MTFDQVAILALLAAMFLVFATERFRVEIVALCGLAIALALGLVTPQRAFAGFSNAAVITVAEILLIVGVLARSHGIERFAGNIAARAGGERMVVAMLCFTGAAVSVFMNNIGALALMFPVALSVCARLGIAIERVLMPLSFATLLGGTISLTGTPANLIANQWMIAETGGEFAYFELGLLGLPVALAGVIWLILWRRPPAPAAQDAAVPAPSARFAFPAALPAGSSWIGRDPDAASTEADSAILAVIRNGRPLVQRGSIRLMAGDTLLIESTPDQLDALAGAGVLASAEAGAAHPARMQAVVMPDSFLLGSRLGEIVSFEQAGLRVIGIAGRRHHGEAVFDQIAIGLGDVLLLSGDGEAMRAAAIESGLMPLAAPVPASTDKVATGPAVAIFALGIAATALGLAPPEIAFGGVVLVMALTGSLRIAPALQQLNWSIILLLAAMIPLGIAVAETGAAAVIADLIVGQIPGHEPLLVASVVLLLAIAITPFVDNVSTAAVLSPIAAGIATRAGVPIEPLLIAVAVGASLDFLTPFGHHNNAVVMGAAGYRFSDFPRLGVPLLAICVPVAILTLWLIWF